MLAMLMDFDVFMERYGYDILLVLMVVFTFGFLGWFLLFLSSLATFFLALFVAVYVGLSMLLRRLYVFLFGEDPEFASDSPVVTTFTKLQEEKNQKFGKYL